ncbi:MAG: ornithine cyclodeaminase family protein [Acidobacteria bacterium]|nr:ornithine cyclodeaminase family protein [Acidobacteriota bacterium]
MTRILTRADIQSLLSFDDYVLEVERAFRLYAEGLALKPGLLHTDAADGEFHVKAGGLALSKVYYGVKINGAFFQNMARRGMPNIQGTIVLCDGENGQPLAFMDSGEITVQRTGAASAVAARYLARADSQVATICGCGRQGRVQLRALTHVLPIRRVYAFDQDHGAAERFALEMAAAFGIEVIPTSDPDGAIRQSDVCATCTPSRHAYVHASAIRPGLFIAAVGADSPDKQELDPAILRAAAVVVDILDQCAAVGELHHALSSGLMTRADVRADLGEVITGRKPGRTSPDEVLVYDATGTALQDVAAAAAAYERAVAQGVGSVVTLA